MENRKTISGVCSSRQVMQMLLNLTVLPGDGIGPEVTGEAVRVLEYC